MEIVYRDKDIVVCIKPAGVLSTDEPGGMPELLRAQLGTDNVRSVHRLDRVVSGLMVYALRSKAASELSRQMRENQFHKEYVAVIRGTPQRQEDTLRDLLLRNKEERKTYVVTQPQKDAQEAALHYSVLGTKNGLSKVAIQLLTGRTHQIRCQFASRGWPLVGDRKYGGEAEEGDIALWSRRLSFLHPYSGEPMTFCREPENSYPWMLFRS